MKKKPDFSKLTEFGKIIDSVGPDPRAFKPSSSESADRGRSIIQVITMLKFKRETSGTSAIILLITEHTATNHIRRFFLETSSRTMGPAQGVQMADLTKFWQLGPTEPTVFANSVLFNQS
jgi:hypothetical protein